MKYLVKKKKMNSKGYFFFKANSIDNDFVRIFILIREPGYRFELLCFDVRACETSDGRTDTEEGRGAPRPRGGLGSVWRRSQGL